MFASSGVSHAHTFTSFECSLSEMPPLRKETREGSFRICYRLVRVQSCFCSALVTVRPIGLHETRVSFEPLRTSSSLYALPLRHPVFYLPQERLLKPTNRPLHFNKRIHGVGVIPDAAQYRDALHGEFLDFVEILVVDAAEGDNGR